MTPPIPSSVFVFVIVTKKSPIKTNQSTKHHHSKPSMTHATALNHAPCTALPFTIVPPWSGGEKM